MPAQRDLTGERFGKLLVIKADGRVFWGRDMVAWMCRCDCGAEVRVPQRRLTTSTKSHQIDSCEDCRAVPCEICGKGVPVATNAKTCSPECKAEKNRRYQLSYYHDVRAVDPEDTEKRRARKREAWANLPPSEKALIWAQRRASEDREKVNARARERHRERVLTDEGYLAQKAEAALRHKEKTPEEKRREYARNYARKRRADKSSLDMLRAVDKMRDETDG